MDQVDQAAATRAVAADASRVQATIARATADLAAGREAEALELLWSVIHAGYPGADARVLLGEVLVRRGDAAGADLLAQAVDDPTWGARARAALQTASVRRPDHAAPALGPLLVSPLRASRAGLPPTLSRALRDADDDLAHGRFESALDLTLFAETIVPDRLALFVRHAELLVVTGRERQALRLASTIRRLAALRGEPEHELQLLRVVAHAAPTREHLLTLARGALAAGDAALAEQYLPIAIATHVAEGNTADARALAAEWHRGAPHSALARLTYVRELLRAGDVAAAATLTREAGQDAASRVAALAVAAAAGDTAQWSLIGRLARATAAGHLDRGEVPRLLADIAAAAPQIPTMPALRAVLALALGEAGQVQTLLRGYRPPDPMAAFVAAVCTVRARGSAADPADVLPMLRVAFDLAGRPEVTPLLAESPLFDPPATPESLGEALAELLLQRGDAAAAAQVYQQLAARRPNQHRFVRAYAEAMGRAGKPDEALAQLDALRQREEAAGQHAEAEQTLQVMVRLAPGRIALRERLVESYLQRGKVAEALSELFLLAQLVERRGRAGEARTYLRRAAEIATLTGAWQQVEAIYTHMIRLAPDDLEVRHAAAAAFLQHGRIADAKAQLQEAVRIALDHGDPDEAIAALHQTIALDPADPVPYHRLGELLAAVGEYGQAERVYRRLAQLLPDDPSVKAKQAALAALARGQS
ncbi:MAG: tetratricopeptide repeat protein [Sphaerobacter sp.]|nr:tetratricopeptide repeat protein [Sphaerobacter sp.]